MRQTSRDGFSLVELMIVVSIVGILSAIAIPTFQGYLLKSRTSEATETIGAIRLREESYRAEFGEYCETVPTDGSGGVGDLDSHNNLLPNPYDAVSARGPVSASDSTNTTARNKFAQLGMRFNTAMRFGYGVAAGPPTDLPGFGWDASNADFWFIARAVADLDFDGTYVTFEAYSGTSSVWVGNTDDDSVAAKGYD